MPMEIEGQTFYKSAEACQIAGISKSTLHRWIREGVAPEVKHKDRNGWRLFTQQEIQGIIAEATRIYKR